MKEKFKNWLEKHKFIYGVGLTFVSLCMLATGVAYYGENIIKNHGLDEPITLEFED